MLSGGKRWKTTIGLISKKATLHVQHTFFVHFFAVVLHDFNVKLPETFYGGNFARVLVHFFSLPLIFSLHWWPLAFLILSPPLQNFHVVFPTKNFSFVFFLVELRWPAAYFLSFSAFPIALYSKFVDGRLVGRSGSVRSQDYQIF